MTASMSHKTFQFIEYTTIFKSENRELKTGELYKDDFDAIDKMKEQLPKGMLEFLGSDSIRFKQFVGNIFLPSGNCIEILPKINKPNCANENNYSQVCRHSLLHMLTRVFKLKINTSSIGSSSLAKFPLQDIFIRFFCQQLEEELHKGYLRTYVSEEDNLSTMRGRLVFNDHIRVNMVNKARFYCQYDEFTEDNVFNQQLKAVIRVFKNRVQSQDTHRHLTDLEFAFADVRDVMVDTLVIERLHFTRLNDRFKPIFDLATLILAGKSPNMSTGENTAPAMLFDMNKLFEEFIAIELERKLYSKTSISANYSLSSQDQSLKLATDAFQLKPDIVIRKENSVVSIMDTKWKVKEANGTIKVSQEDAYQMYAYGHRFSCNHLALIYPKLPSGVRSKSFNLVKNRDSAECLSLKVYQVPLIFSSQEGESAFDEKLEEIVKVFEE